MSPAEPETSAPRTRRPARPRSASDFLDDTLGRRTAHELVREHLRRAILSGAAPGGSRLVQADVAARLRVSTTPVREALRDLVTEGLVEFDPHRGAVVHKPNLEEVLELYAVRELIEPFALRFAYARRPDTTLAEASAIQAQLDETTDPSTWAELNWRFHEALIAPASQRLRSIVKMLHDASALYVARAVTVDAERIASGNREHHEMLAALKRGDVDTAASHLKAHMSSTLTGILIFARTELDGEVATEGAPAGDAR
ncbi:MAG TPA: GntR family transcriptional regulator [Acidimicrobiales bacterium]|nr:GntR family transcriptional regulator [Acidimicrobiales bacterium]